MSRQFLKASTCIIPFLLAAPCFAISCTAAVPAGQANGGSDGGVHYDDAGNVIPDDSGLPPQLPSACTRNGNEARVTMAGDVRSFGIIWDHDHYVVAYGSNAAGTGVFAQRLDASGAPMGNPVTIAQTSDLSGLPRVIAIPSGYFVVWEEGNTTKNVMARMLGPDLMPQGTTATLAHTTSTQARPVASVAAGGIAVSWMDQINGVMSLQVGLIDTSMKMTGPNRIDMNDNADYPWLAGDDKALGLLFSDKKAGPYDIHFAQLDMAHLTATNDVTVRTGPMGDALLGRMIKTSFGYLAAWEDQTTVDATEVHMSLLGPDGSKIADGLVEEDNSGNANWPNMAWDGSAAGIVYYQWRSEEHTPQIFMSFVDGMGKRVGGLHDLRVSSTPGNGEAKFPDVVWTGNEFGVMWVDSRDGGHSLYFARVTCKG